MSIPSYYLFSFVFAIAFDIFTTIRLCQCQFFNINFIYKFSHSKKSDQKFILDNLWGRIRIIISYKIACQQRFRFRSQLVDFDFFFFEKISYFKMMLSLPNEQLANYIEPSCGKSILIRLRAIFCVLNFETKSKLNRIKLLTGNSGLKSSVLQSLDLISVTKIFFRSTN